MSVYVKPRSSEPAVHVAPKFELAAIRPSSSRIQPLVTDANRTSSGEPRPAGAASSDHEAPASFESNTTAEPARSPVAHPRRSSMKNASRSTSGPAGSAPAPHVTP